MNIIFGTKGIASKLKDLNDIDLCSLHSLVRKIYGFLPNAEIGIIEILAENKDELPTKKSLVLANSINQVLDLNRTIVFGTDPGDEEIAITSVKGSFNQFIINFTNETDSAQIIISEQYNFFTYSL